MIGQVRVPLHKLFSLSNANLKDIWVQLKDPDGLQLKDVSGQIAALRLVLNFVVLGETSSAWSASAFNALVVERSTKLSKQVVESLKPFIQEASLAADAVDEFERLMASSNDKISVEGMAEAAQTLKVEMSPDLIMLRMLINSEYGEYVVDFDEFCKTLNILQSQTEKDDAVDDEQAGLVQSSDQNVDDGLKQQTKQEPGPATEITSEQLVRKDVDPAVGMRVKLSADAVERFPHLLEESGWTLKEGACAVAFFFSEVRSIIVTRLC